MKCVVILGFGKGKCGEASIGFHCKVGLYYWFHFHRHLYLKKSRDYLLSICRRTLKTMKHQIEDEDGWTLLTLSITGQMAIQNLPAHFLWALITCRISILTRYLWLTNVHLNTLMTTWLFKCWVLQALFASGSLAKWGQKPNKVDFCCKIEYESENKIYLMHHFSIV